MIDPVTLGLIGGGLGLFKSGGDKAQREADERRNAIMKANSTYADYTPGKVQEYNPWGDIAQFGMAGAGLGQSFQQQGADMALKKAQTGAFNRTQNLGGGNNTTVVNDGYQSSRSWRPGNTRYADENYQQNPDGTWSAIRKQQSIGD